MPPIPLDYETPGEEPRFDLAIVCPACGKDGAVRGTLVGGELWHFYPSGMTHSVLVNGRVTAYSYACVACGVVTTVVDPDELRKVLGVGQKRQGDGE
jgi:hypothetical protein